MTPKQQELLRIIRNTVVHEGRKPTFKEMRDYMKVTSNQTIIDWLTALEKQKYLSWKEGKVQGVNLNTNPAHPAQHSSVTRRKDPSEFTKNAIETLAKRAAQACSNPDCRRPTSGSHSDKDKAVVVGKAAHIRGQHRGSARYDESMTDEERGDILNGIWLCSVCHDAVDRDEKKYTVDLLQQWRQDHENAVSRAMLSSFGFRYDSPIAATAKADVLEDENIKKAMEAWGQGDIKTALKYSQDAYYIGTDEIKLQAITNMVLLSHDPKEELTRASYYISLCEEGISLAKSINDLSTASVLKAHEAFYLQNRAFSNSIEVYRETQTRQLVGYPTMSNAQVKQLLEFINKDAVEIDRLLNEAQIDSYNTKNYQAMAHVKMTTGNVIGMTYFFTKHLGGDTGQIEHGTVKALTDAKSIYEKLGDKEGIGNSLHNLANNLRFFGDVERAKKYAAEALKIAQEIGYKELEAKAKELLEDRLNG